MTNSKEKDELYRKRELPKFVRAIVQGLKTEKDCYKAVGKLWRQLQARDFNMILRFLILDLKSGNFENAMIGF